MNLPKNEVLRDEFEFWQDILIFDVLNFRILNF